MISLNSVNSLLLSDTHLEFLIFVLSDLNIWTANVITVIYEDISIINRNIDRALRNTPEIKSLSKIGVNSTAKLVR